VIGAERCHRAARFFRERKSTMHDVPPHSPDDRHPIAQQLDESNGRIKRPQRSDRNMKDVARGSDVERREAGRGVKV
jgi:hypothetical protein